MPGAQDSWVETSGNSLWKSLPVEISPSPGGRKREFSHTPLQKSNWRPGISEGADLNSGDLQVLGQHSPVLCLKQGNPATSLLTGQELM